MARALRVPKLDLASILAQQNPQIDLRLDAYESSTRSFLKAVSAYAQNAQAEITRWKTTHVAGKKRIAEKTQNETHACKVRELELIAELEKEHEERKEAELAVAAFERQLASIKDQCALLDAEIEQRRAVVNNLHREREREHALLNTHASRTSSELTECEFRLCSVVEGIDKDTILVRFTHIDPADQQREFSVVVDVSADIYRSSLARLWRICPAHLDGLNRVPLLLCLRVPVAAHISSAWTSLMGRKSRAKCQNLCRRPFGLRGASCYYCGGGGAPASSRRAAGAPPRRPTTRGTPPRRGARPPPPECP
ncbi:hypothetical protein PsYK624_137600 [Phanerochaete sordida]|uniref:Kinetochore protein SPC25 n=1 Tax=Phanerochaete sordida TaxID=48140 RepID=A0A9P3LKB6_9APHY|nr:hypothetical protein PsYK624_137600 [Phanerochaete sordida]